MKYYVNPKMEIAMFNGCDVITTSAGGPTTDSNLLDQNTTYANKVEVAFADAVSTYASMNE